MPFTLNSSRLANLQMPEYPDPVQDYAKAMSLRQMMDMAKVRQQELQMHQAQMLENQRKAQWELEDRLRSASLRDLFAKKPNASFEEIAAIDAPTAIKLETERRQMRTAQLTQQEKERAADTAKQQQIADVLYGVRNVQDPGQRQAAMDEATMMDLLRPEAQRLGLGKIGQETPLAPTEQGFQSRYAAAYTPEKLQSLLTNEAKAKTDQEKEALQASLEQGKLAGGTLGFVADQDSLTKWYKELPAFWRAKIGPPPTYNDATMQRLNRMFLTPDQRERHGALDQPHKIIAAINNPLTPPAEIPRLKQQLKDTVQYQQAIQRDRLLTPAEFAQQLDLAKARSTALQEGKPPTQGEELLAGYAARVKQANKGFETLTMGGKELAWNKVAPFDFMKTEAGLNFAQDERNFINAVLRRESGAAISPGEFSSARDQYIPQPNDPPSTLEKKRQNRLIVQQNLIRGSGRAYVDPDELLRQAGVDVPALGGGGSQPPKRAGGAPPAGNIPNPLVNPPPTTAPKAAKQEYKEKAQGPNGHMIGSNDGQKTWYDVETGKRVY